MPQPLACLRHTTGPVLELGSGWFSTPLAAAFATNHLVWTIETNPEWYDRISRVATYPPITRHRHQILYVPDHDDAQILDHEWSVVLLDQEPLPRRGHDARWLPTVGVRTGPPFVHDSVTGFLVERLPPGSECVASDDATALDIYVGKLRQAQSLNRLEVCEPADMTFRTARIVEAIIDALNEARAVDLPIA